jgi:uncharacterized protein YqgC (DUF456 family)
LPALPGVPFATLAVLLVHFTLNKYPWYILTIVIVLTILVSFVDYVVPIWGTKKYGGSPSGVRGSTLGLIIGALVSFMSGGIGIVALFAGPFLGAYIGERYFAKAEKKVALRSAWGSLVGFMAGTIGKLAVVSIIAVIFVIGVIRYF